MDPAGWGDRAVLPQRRPHLVIQFEHDGQRYCGGYGVDQDLTIREIWLNSHKTSSFLDTVVCDAAVAVSIALQHGAKIETLRSAMKRNPNGAAASPLGRLLDLIAEEPF